MDNTEKKLRDWKGPVKKRAITRDEIIKGWKEFADDYNVEVSDECL